MHEFEMLPNPQLQFIGELDAQNELFKAVAAAKAEFAAVSKETEGQIGNVKFRYADLHALVEATRGPLSKHGVAVMQFLNGNGESCVLSTVIAGHGAQIRSAITFLRAGDVKEFGKVTTYLRRYAYQAALLLDGDRDADSGDAQLPQKRREPPPVQRVQERTEERAAAKPAPPTEPAQAPRHSTMPPRNQSSRVPPRDTKPPESQRSLSYDGAPSADQKLLLRTLLLDKGWNKVRVGEFCFERFAVQPHQMTQAHISEFIHYLQESDHAEA